QPRWRAAKVSGQVGIEFRYCFSERTCQRLGALSWMGTHDDRGKLCRWRRSEQRHVKTPVIGLSIEWSLHQGIGHYPDNRSPWAWLDWIVNSDTTPYCSFATEILVRETGVHNCDRLFLVAVFNGEVAPFEHLQPESCKVVVRDRFPVALRPVAIREVVLSVDLVFTEVREGHAKAVAHGCTFERWICMERTQSALEK